MKPKITSSWYIEEPSRNSLGVWASGKSINMSDDSTGEALSIKASEARWLANRLIEASDWLAAQEQADD